jgi:hypothetical protein
VKLQASHFRERLAGIRKIAEILSRRGLQTIYEYRKRHPSYGECATHLTKLGPIDMNQAVLDFV